MALNLTQPTHTRSLEACATHTQPSACAQSAGLSMNTHTLQTQATPTLIPKTQHRHTSLRTQHRHTPVRPNVGEDPSEFSWYTTIRFNTGTCTTLKTITDKTTYRIQHTYIPPEPR